MRYRDIVHSQREDLSAMVVRSCILCRPIPHLPFQKETTQRVVLKQ